MLPKELSKLVPKDHLMTETEWRQIGVQQSRGWVINLINTVKSDLKYPGVRLLTTQALIIRINNFPSGLLDTKFTGGIQGDWLKCIDELGGVEKNRQ